MYFKVFVHDIIKSFVSLHDDETLIFSWDSNSINFLDGTKYVLYQLEQLTVPGKLSNDYLDLMEMTHKIYDYSKHNLDLYPKNIRHKVTFAPFLPSLNSTYHNNINCDNDILFYGYLSDRRVKILNTLYESGYDKIFWHNDLDLNSMKETIYNSRFVLSYGTHSNIHNDSFRVSLALNLGANILYEPTQERWYDDYLLSNFSNRIQLLN